MVKFHKFASLIEIKLKNNEKQVLDEKLKLKKLKQKM